jgi:hypothetical protein
LRVRAEGSYLMTVVKTVVGVVTTRVVEYVAVVVVGTSDVEISVVCIQLGLQFMTHI